MDDRMSVWTDAFVGVTDGKISYLSKHAPEEKPDQIIDATGMVLMPGLINCHTHLPMQLLRGYADDLKLQEWLNDYIFPREDRLDGRCVRAATTLAVAECLKFGVTSVSDMYYFCDDICDVIAKSGMKANISRGTSMFWATTSILRSSPPVRSWSHSKRSGTITTMGRIKIEASIHAEYTSTYQLWDALSEFCHQRGDRYAGACAETKLNTTSASSATG